MTLNRYFAVGAVLFSSFLLVQCRPQEPYPKPRGYFRVEMPTKGYKDFNDAAFPFSFRYPQYGTITQDSNVVKEYNNPYWINVYLPDFDATIYLSYRKIDTQTPFEVLVNESFKLSYKHDIKADYIKSPDIETKQGYKGVYFTVGGDAASAYQFFISDEKQHFMRGSLYFNTTPNADSLRPMYNFLKEDLDTLIHSFQFN